MEIRNLSYRYKKNGVRAVDNVSFGLSKGEIAVLLGPNGAGKSTLISLIAGFIKPEEGSIVIEDKDLTDMKAAERSRKIGYVPQSLSFGSLSVYDTVLLGRLPYFHFAPCHKDREAVLETMERLGLLPFKDKNVNELSGGERQLVAIASALVKKPSLLILDEPTSNLDLANQAKLLRIVKEAAKNEVAVLLSVHDLQEAFLVGDKFLLMKEGKLMKETKNEEITAEDLSLAYGIEVGIAVHNGHRHAFIKEKI